jgi:hypothetical protein
MPTNGVYYSTSAFLGLADRTNLRVDNYDCQMCSCNASASPYYSNRENVLLQDQVLRPLCFLGNDADDCSRSSETCILELSKRLSLIQDTRYSPSSPKLSCRNGYGLGCHGYDDYSSYAGLDRERLSGWHDAAVIEAYERINAMKSVNNEFMDPASVPVNIPVGQTGNQLS